MRCLAVLAALWLPGPAAATTFSFGTILPTDVITQLTLAPTSGPTKTNYDPTTGILHVEAWLSQINFANRPSITGISNQTYKVIFTSDITFTGAFSVTELPPLSGNPRLFVAGFMNGAVMDLSLFDSDPSFALTVLDADYIGNLSLTGQESVAPVSGTLSGELVVLPSSDPDFQAAFSPQLHLNASLSSFQSDTFAVGTNLCNLVKNDGLLSGINWGGTTVCGPGYGLDDFNVNSTLFITPEPGTGVLFALGLIGVAALRRK